MVFPQNLVGSAKDWGYVFRMADDSMDSTEAVARRHGNLRIRCGKCGHVLIAGPAQIRAMFPRMMMLDTARFRLRCKACGGRMHEIQVLRKIDR